MSKKVVWDEVMQMNKYEDFKRVIQKAGHIVVFTEFRNGITDDWITKTEQRLKITLPDSYKWWLKNYGDGEIHGDVIFSVYGHYFDMLLKRDLVYMHEINLKHAYYPSNFMIICETGKEVFGFDVSELDHNNEYPVYEVNKRELYADNFLEFLKKRINVKNRSVALN